MRSSIGSRCPRPSPFTSIIACYLGVLILRLELNMLSLIILIVSCMTCIFFVWLYYSVVLWLYVVFSLWVAFILLPIWLHLFLWLIKVGIYRKNKVLKISSTLIWALNFDSKLVDVKNTRILDSFISIYC